MRIWSRNARGWARAFPAIAHAIAVLPFDSCVLDGAALTPGEDCWPKFHALRSAVDRDTATLMVIELLQVGLQDLRAWPLIERRAWLEDILKWAPSARYSEANGRWRCTLSACLRSQPRRGGLKEEACFDLSSAVLLQEMPPSFRERAHSELEIT